MPKLYAPISVSLPADLLKRLDELVKKVGITRHAWLREAIRRQLERES